MSRLNRQVCKLLIVGVFTGCAHKTEVSQPIPSPAPSPPAAPTASAPSFRFEELKQAWQLFIKDGRYRMAEAKDFRFSAEARRDMGAQRFEAYTASPVVYWWGGTGVIVVDTTRTDENRFGLIVFMEPDNLHSEKKTKPCPYKAVWLYKNTDLSRTGLEQASGYWFVIKYADSGKRTSKDERMFGWKHRNLCG